MGNRILLICPYLDLQKTGDIDFAKWNVKIGILLWGSFLPLKVSFGPLRVILSILKVDFDPLWVNFELLKTDFLALGGFTTTKICGKPQRLLAGISKFPVISRLFCTPNASPNIPYQPQKSSRDLLHGNQHLQLGHTGTNACVIYKCIFCNCSRSYYLSQRKLHITYLIETIVNSLC